jgi:hypothetical protein
VLARDQSPVPVLTPQTSSLESVSHIFNFPIQFLPAITCQVPSNLNFLRKYLFLTWSQNLLRNSRKLVTSSSCNRGNSSSQNVKSPWSRLRQRVHEVTGRSRNTKNHSSKYGSLLKLADEERRIIHGARRSNSQIRLNPTSDVN